jgi:hypothetical protein
VKIVFLFHKKSLQKDGKFGKMFIFKILEKTIIIGKA